MGDDSSSCDNDGAIELLLLPVLRDGLHWIHRIVLSDSSIRVDPREFPKRIAACKITEIRDDYFRATSILLILFTHHTHRTNWDSFPVFHVCIAT